MAFSFLSAIAAVFFYSEWIYAWGGMELSFLSGQLCIFHSYAADWIYDRIWREQEENTTEDGQEEKDQLVELNYNSN
jgi:hypothetical protein